MKICYRVGSIVVLALSMSACMDDYLTTEPETILTNEQVWTDPQMILGVLSNFYSRLPDYLDLTSASTFAQWDEAVYSGNTGSEGPNLIQMYAYSTLQSWNYSLIRDINLAIERIGETTSSSLTPLLKEQLISEMRFQRAWIYFDLVKRMGGVPLVTTQQIYDFGGDPSYLQQPRNTEAEIYDFIASELDDIAPKLANAGDVTRANRYTALALKSRAMLYAGSLARHNSEMAAPISLPGDEVGIPSSRAAEYYQKSLDASREIINSGEYALYAANADPRQNFYEVLTTKSGNREAIWVKDYSASGARTHNFTQCTIPPSLTVSACGTSLGAALSPRLQLVENFDYLDGSEGTLRGVGTGSNTAEGQANWIFYDRPEDIFAGKDARLWGTVILPGTSFRDSPMRLQAGVYVWNANANKYDKVEGPTASVHTDGAMLSGQDGPKAFQANVTPTGFYLRKYLDPAASGATGAGSDVWWVRFRLGEIYLNATEAAFELGLLPEATGYLNTLRVRAGFPANSLASLSRDKIRSERWSELAFEDHRLWDLKRWRTAHILWDGSPASPTANSFSLWGYRIDRPGHPNHGKYVYDRIQTTRLTYPRFFREGNYYSEIPASALNNNPKLVRNPFH